jgi:ribosomal protein S3AE
VRGKELIAIPNKMELVKSYIRRMMRKRTDYVEDSFNAKCKDVNVMVKPFLITRKKVSRAIRKNLRNTAKTFLLEYLKDREFNEVCEELRNGSLQKALLPKLKKVYPLSFCDLRVFETKEISKISLDKIMESAKKEEIVKDIQDVQIEEEGESKE